MRAKLSSIRTNLYRGAFPDGAPDTSPEFTDD
jgi:hypothetical protein